MNHVEIQFELELLVTNNWLHFLLIGIVSITFFYNGVECSSLNSNEGLNDQLNIELKLELIESYPLLLRLLRIDNESTALTFSVCDD